MEEGITDYVPEELKKVIDEISSQKFGDLTEMKPMLNALIEGKDYYCLCWDFKSYMKAQGLVDESYKDKAKWNKMSILSTARTWKFSTDRTIKEYAEKV